MGFTINSKFGKLLMPSGGRLSWIADCYDLEIEMSISRQDFMWSCRYRRAFSASGSLCISEVDSSAKEYALMGIEPTSINGFTLDVGTDDLKDIESLQFPNVLFIPSPIIQETTKNDSVKFIFLGCPNILCWYR